MISRINKVCFSFLKCIFYFISALFQLPKKKMFFLVFINNNNTSLEVIIWTAKTQVICPSFYGAFLCVKEHPEQSSKCLLLCSTEEAIRVWNGMNVNKWWQNMTYSWSISDPQESDNNKAVASRWGTLRHFIGVQTLSVWSEGYNCLIMEMKGWCTVTLSQTCCVISIQLVPREEKVANGWLSSALNAYAFWSVSINYTEWLVGPKWFPVDVCECLRMIIIHLWKSHFHLCDWRLWLHCHLVHENIR